MTEETTLGISNKTWAVWNWVQQFYLLESLSEEPMQKSKQLEDSENMSNLKRTLGSLLKSIQTF